MSARVVTFKPASKGLVQSGGGLTPPPALDFDALMFLSVWHQMSPEDQSLLTGMAERLVAAEARRRAPAKREAAQKKGGE